MNDPFVESEVDRTKSKWVANTFREFGKPKTTLRALFYFALLRAEPDYPICGGFVGEIRVTRRYHENDGMKLPKWVGKAQKMGYIPKDAILEEVPGEQVFLPAPEKRAELGPELWLNKSALTPLLLPLCDKLGLTLVSVQSRPSREAVVALLQRAKGGTTTVFCLSDLSAEGYLFCEELAQGVVKSVSGPDRPDIRIKKIGLTPQQVIDLEIHMVPGRKADKQTQGRFKKYLEPFHLDPRRIVELDALEVYHPSGISGFLEEILADTLNR